MRILIVQLSSLGDIVHALPVIHDLRRWWPGAQVDWVVEPAFAPLLGQVDGLHSVIECPMRRWRREWWRRSTRTEWRTFRSLLQRAHYDAVLDLQGLTKSAVIAWLANGRSHGPANRTEGSSFEAPARWLVDDAIPLRPRIHAIDRSREIAARALGYWVSGPPCLGLRAAELFEADAPSQRPPRRGTLVRHFMCCVDTVSDELAPATRPRGVLKAVTASSSGVRRHALRPE